jgi:hypothetical protein
MLTVEQVLQAGHAIDTAKSCTGGICMMDDEIFKKVSIHGLQVSRANADVYCSKR